MLITCCKKCSRFIWIKYEYIIYHHACLFPFTFLNVATRKFTFTNVDCISFLLEGSTLGLAVRSKGQWYSEPHLVPCLWVEVTSAPCTHGLMFVFTISPKLTQNIKLLFISNLRKIIV